MEYITFSQITARLRQLDESELKKIINDIKKMSDESNKKSAVEVLESWTKFRDAANKFIIKYNELRAEQDDDLDIFGGPTSWEATLEEE